MIEEEISRQMLTQTKDKTFSDKVLAKEEVEKIRNLIKKKDLSREELQDILYLMVGTEQKLMNYGTWDRYFLTKFFVWIRSFFETIEHYYDYQDKLKNNKIINKDINDVNKKVEDTSKILGEVKEMYDLLKKNKDENIQKEIKSLYSKYVTDIKEIKQDEESIYKGEIKQMYDQLMNMWIHTAKFLIDLYLHLSRSTLSVGGSAFTEILRNKYEISYPEINKQSEEKKGLLRW